MESVAHGRRYKIILAVSFALVALVCLPQVGVARVGAQPNIVFVMLDDAGYADFGATGSGFIQTPRIDQLAAEGVTLTHYYAAAPLCAPTRISLLTGEYPGKLWMRANGNSGVSDETLTMPQLLASSGYVTGHVGKWHIRDNDSSEYTPGTAGFDLDVRFKSSLASSSSYYDPFITIDNTKVVHHAGEHLTEVLIDYAIDFVTEHAEQTPFFLQLWLWAPHVPLEPPADWAALYPDTDEGRVGALMSDADEQIGRLFDALESLGVADDTLVVITSDNGGDRHTHENDPLLGPSNAPYRGFKNEMYEGGIRVPLFARWPNGGVLPATTNDSLAMSFDLVQTFSELAGVDVSALDYPGQSLVPALGGAVIPRFPRLHWELKQKGLYFVDPEGVLDDFAVRDGDWKLVREGGSVELFNIDNDPSESNDLSASQPVILDALLAANRDWRRNTGRIRHEIEFVDGDVDISGIVWTFSGGGVELEDSLFYNLRENDFSFKARVTPSISPPSSWQLIAKRNESWELIILQNGRLRLKVFGPGSQQTVLSSSTPVVLGQPFDVAFSIFGWSADGSSVRLYKDGVLEAETHELSNVASAPTPIKVGNTGDLTRPFLGTIEDLALYSVALRPDEIQELFEEP